MMPKFIFLFGRSCVFLLNPANLTAVKPTVTTKSEKKISQLSFGTMIFKHYYQEFASNSHMEVRSFTEKLQVWDPVSTRNLVDFGQFDRIFSNNYGLLGLFWVVWNHSYLLMLVRAKSIIFTLSHLNLDAKSISAQCGGGQNNIDIVINNKF